MCIATNAKPITSTMNEIAVYISSLQDYLQPIATHDSFKTLKL